MIAGKHELHHERIRALLPRQYQHEGPGGTRTVHIHMPTALQEYVPGRFTRAWNLMRDYATARVVITSALHAGLPSLAFDSPVIFVQGQKNFIVDRRFLGLVNLFPHVHLFRADAGTGDNPRLQVLPVLETYDYDHPLPPSQLRAAIGRSGSVGPAVAAGARVVSPDGHLQLDTMRRDLISRLRLACPAIDAFYTMVHGNGAT